MWAGQPEDFLKRGLSTPTDEPKLVAWGGRDLAQCLLSRLEQMAQPPLVSQKVKSAVKCVTWEPWVPLALGSHLNTANFSSGEKQRNLWAPPGGGLCIASNGAWKSGLGEPQGLGKELSLGPRTNQTSLPPTPPCTLAPGAHPPLMGSSLKPRQETRLGLWARSRLGASQGLSS